MRTDVAAPDGRRGYELIIAAESSLIADAIRVAILDEAAISLCDALEPVALSAR